MKKIRAVLAAVLMAVTLSACGADSQNTEIQNTDRNDFTNEDMRDTVGEDLEYASTEKEPVRVPENFVFIHGGTFEMGSPDTESWRSEDETQHTVTVSDFYMSIYELTQAEYREITGENPSSFSGDELPVESITWLDAIQYCNQRSEKEGLTPVYVVNGQDVTWDRSADGYRLPTEAEWEYACRAGMATPFNTENSISAEEANYYGHYPYEIEDNYFSQGNLSTKPGEYRQTTVAVDSFSPNGWGLYNMHGNVSEWVWDYYGAYRTEEQIDPTGTESGTLRVYRGGGWNDFAKNMRSAYRATLAEDKGSFNIGLRLVRNAVSGTGSVISAGTQNMAETGGKVLIAFFSWGGNTRGIAQEIQSQTGEDLFEMELMEPYSTDYNTVLDEAQRDQNEQARPELTNHVENMEEYDTIILGYPNWRYTAPMPVFSFLEENDFSGKKVVLFCSHGTGGLASSVQDLSAVLQGSEVEGNVIGVYRDEVSSSQDTIKEWLRESGY